MKYANPLLLLVDCVADDGFDHEELSLHDDPGALVGVSMDSRVGVVLDEALATTIVGVFATEISCTCPGPRVPNEPGGNYGWFTAGVLANAAARNVTCQVVH